MDDVTQVMEKSTAVSELLESSIQQWPEFGAAIWLVKCVTISLVVIGTVGNALSFTVLMRRRMRKNSINIYLAVLACADTVVLYVSAFKTWLRVMTGFELLHVSDVCCKITIFTFMLASHLSAWLIVLVTTDRFVVVRFPLRAVRICTARRSVLAVAILTGVLVLYNLHLLWTMHLHEFDDGNMQCAPASTDSFMNGPFNYVRLASYTLVPFMVVITMDAAIITDLCRTSAERLGNVDWKTNRKKGQLLSSSTSTTAASTSTKNSRQNRYQVTIMLLVVSFSWLMLTLPYTVISLINFDYVSSHTRAVVFLLKTVSFLLMYLNHSCNFFLYCMAGKRFRTEFLATFRPSRMRTPSRRRSIVFTLKEQTPLAFEKRKLNIDIKQ